MRRRGAPTPRVRLPGLRPGKASSRPGAASSRTPSPPVPDAAASQRTSSRGGLGRVLRGAAHRLAPVVLLAVSATPLGAQTLLTQEEALALAFPAPAEIERRTAYLSEAQLERARMLAGGSVDIGTGIVTYYVGARNGTPAGAAYFDVHRVRTKNEVVMVVVDPDARVRRVDVLKFTEPPEYRAPEGWIDQLEGRPLDDELSVRGAIRNLTGATLTARALTEAVRRVLAIHTVVAPFGSPDIPSGPGGRS